MSAISSPKTKICPLCHAEDPDNFYQGQMRDYFRCTQCHLVFIPPEQRISKEEEKAQYDSHQNSPDDKRYRDFLSRLFVPLNQRIKPASHGLDFGSGPGPTLSVMFEEKGHTVSLYDPHYAPDETVFEKQYDFVTTSEVVEHLCDPMEELNRLWKCLKKEGWFGVMTKLVIDQPAFKNWHYKNEPTHICFYSKETFQWLALKWNAKLEFYGNDVMLFKKSHKR